MLNLSFILILRPDIITWQLMAGVTSYLIFLIGNLIINFAHLYVQYIDVLLGIALVSMYGIYFYAFGWGLYRYSEAHVWAINTLKDVREKWVIWILLLIVNFIILYIYSSNHCILIIPLIVICLMCIWKITDNECIKDKILLCIMSLIALFMLYICAYHILWNILLFNMEENCNSGSGIYGYSCFSLVPISLPRFYENIADSAGNIPLLPPLNNVGFSRDNMWVRLPNFWHLTPGWHLITSGEFLYGGPQQRICAIHVFCVKPPTFVPFHRFNSFFAVMLHQLWMAGYTDVNNSNVISNVINELGPFDAYRLYWRAFLAHEGLPHNSPLTVEILHRLARSNPDPDQNITVWMTEQEANSNIGR